jgi:hypothetical protein
MDEMPSSEFRRCYATLLRSTRVTVNGHPIGVWHPLTAVADGVIGEDGLTPIERQTHRTAPSFSSRPFRPVPKP